MFIAQVEHPDYPNRDLSSLRVLGSTGEPWNPESWRWLFETAGRRRLPIINYAGGTEIAGGIVMGNVLAPIKPCSFAGPVPGMAADVVDEHELVTHRRQEGVFFGSVSFSNKFTTGMGSLVGGIGLDLINWPRGLGIRTAADVPPETLVRLGLIYGPIVASFAVVSMWCFSKHRLDRRRHAEIVCSLRERRALEV